MGLFYITFAKRKLKMQVFPTKKPPLWWAGRGTRERAPREGRGAEFVGDEPSLLGVAEAIRETAGRHLKLL